jgi:hypothetical protein
MSRVGVGERDEVSFIRNFWAGRVESQILLSMSLANDVDGSDETRSSIEMSIDAGDETIGESIEVGSRGKVGDESVAGLRRDEVSLPLEIKVGGEVDVEAAMEAGKESAAAMTPAFFILFA